MKHRSWGARLILNFSNSFVKLQGEMNESTVEIKYSATELKIVKAQKILSTNIPPGSKDHVLYLWGYFISINVLDPTPSRPIIDFAWWQLHESLCLGRDFLWNG